MQRQKSFGVWFIWGEEEGDVMKNKGGTEREKRKTTKNTCYIQQGPQPGCTSTWEDL